MSSEQTNNPREFERAALPVAVVSQSAVGARGNFYVGGVYNGATDTMNGQAYVEVIVPREVRRPYPLVLIHGAGQTSASWLQTPDGRKGWADYFVEQGYIVYLMDQPMRGRSGQNSAAGPTRALKVSQVEKQLTASRRSMAWPQAALHSQWPGNGSDSGCKGNSVFDAFYASQVESVASVELSSKQCQAAGAALLDKIGPAILLTHSQSGPYGWLIADARPHLVKAILAIEPSGPLFASVQAANVSGFGWGTTDTEISYAPPVALASELRFATGLSSGRVDGVFRLLQQEPARQLVNLIDIPVLIVTAEASYHAVLDHHTVGYMRQAGVGVDHLCLADVNIRGNGHMMMVEMNNLEIAGLIDQWVMESEI
ncbi:alpha/beta hydrolase [Variovorax sp. H27-G14]|uniref:alpha/beta hydrolase n=1 Tax=Variovorax sp. H27-G14 TaxID=3111914 RepID=UPI0038FC50DC